MELVDGWLEVFASDLALEDVCKGVEERPLSEWLALSLDDSSKESVGTLIGSDSNLWDLEDFELVTECLALDLRDGEPDLELAEGWGPAWGEEDLLDEGGGVQPREDLPELLLWLGVEWVRQLRFVRCLGSIEVVETASS